MSSYDPRSTDARLLYNVPTFNTAVPGTSHSNAFDSSKRDWLNGTPPEVKQFVINAKAATAQIASEYNPMKLRMSSLRALVLRRFLTVTTVLALLWVWVLHRGERAIFREKIASCEWQNWEKWVC